MCVFFSLMPTPVLLSADSKQPLGADSWGLSFCYIVSVAILRQEVIDTQLLLTGLLHWRDESVGRHLGRYVDSDYIGDLDNLCSTTKLEVDLR